MENTCCLFQEIEHGRCINEMHVEEKDRASSHSSKRLTKRRVFTIELFGHVTGSHAMKSLLPHHVIKKSSYGVSRLNVGARKEMLWMLVNQQQPYHAALRRPRLDGD